MLIIGEIINATNKKVGQAIAEKNKDFLQSLAREQDVAGADFIDINAGLGGSEEETKSNMQWLVEIVQEVAGKPLVIDSDSPAVIEAALDKYQGQKVMINSVNAEDEKLNSILPIVAERQVQVIALAMGSEGISDDVNVRLTACDRIMEEASRLGIKPEQIFFDPLVLPLSVNPEHGMCSLKTLEGIKSRYPDAKTIVGLSNISYGLPARKLINQGFLIMAAYTGVDAAILDPRDSRMMSFVKATDALMGKDPYCKGYIKAHRKGLLTE